MGSKITWTTWIKIQTHWWLMKIKQIFRDKSFCQEWWRPHGQKCCYRGKVPLLLWILTWSLSIWGTIKRRKGNHWTKIKLWRSSASSSRSGKWRGSGRSLKVISFSSISWSFRNCKGNNLRQGHKERILTCNYRQLHPEITLKTYFSPKRIGQTTSDLNQINFWRAQNSKKI